MAHWFHFISIKLNDIAELLQISFFPPFAMRLFGFHRAVQEAGGIPAVGCENLIFQLAQKVLIRIRYDSSAAVEMVRPRWVNALDRR